MLWHTVYIFTISPSHLLHLPYSNSGSRESKPGHCNIWGQDTTQYQLVPSGCSWSFLSWYLGGKLRSWGGDQLWHMEGIQYTLAVLHMLYMVYIHNKVYLVLRMYMVCMRYITPTINCMVLRKIVLWIASRIYDYSGVYVWYTCMVGMYVWHMCV